MEVLGVGPLELLFILLIALILLGPNDMVKAGRQLGRLLRSIITSPTWQAVQQTSRDLRYLPNKLMREAGLDEKEAKDILRVQQLQKDLSWSHLQQEMKNPPGASAYDTHEMVPVLLDTPATSLNAVPRSENDPAVPDVPLDPPDFTPPSS